jgi:uncharacterized protein (TIGR03089 family)
VSDIWSELQSRKRAAPSAPLVTFIDARRSERTELSTASVENAAAKIANALRSEYDLEPGDTVAIHLPVHWQRAAWCAGVWTAGCVLVLADGPADPAVRSAALQVAGPAEAEALARLGYDGIAVVSLHPFGLPMTEPLPAGAHDATLPVRQQPDAYLFEPPSGDLPALLVAGGDPMTASQVLETARSRAGEWGLREGGRLLAADDLDLTDGWLAAIAAPLVARASVVLVAGPVDGISGGIAAEGVTATAAPRR